jgi:hypothetical protein
MKIQFGNRIGRHDSTTRQPGRFVHTLVHGYLSLNIHRHFAYLLAVLQPTGGLFAQNTELIRGINFVSTVYNCAGSLASIELLCMEFDIFKKCFPCLFITTLGICLIGNALKYRGACQTNHLKRCSFFNFKSFF